MCCLGRCLWFTSVLNVFFYVLKCIFSLSFLYYVKSVICSMLSLWSAVSVCICVLQTPDLQTTDWVLVCLSVQCRGTKIMWHVTHDMWHVWHMTPHPWHLTPDMWHMTYFGGWTFSPNFSSLALPVCDLWYYEYLEEKAHSPNELINQWQGCL